MRSHAGVTALAILSLALVACGSGGGAAKVHTPDEVGSALLTASEVGTGWTQTQRDVFSTRAPENPSIDESSWCPAASDRAAALTKLAGGSGADVEFSADQPDHDFVGLREQGWSNTDAAAYFTAAKAAATACDGVTWTTAEGTVSMAMVADPKFGDASFSWSASAVLSGASTQWRTQNTVVRSGTTILVFQGTDVVSAASPPAEPDWSAIAARAAAKFATLDGG